MTSSDEYPNNWYVLLVGLPVEGEFLTLAPGLSLRQLKQPLTVFDLAAAGAAGFRAWATIEPLAERCVSEIESARDSATVPGYDALNRAWLASTLLAMRGFHRQLPVACSAYSWQSISGHQERTAEIFREQLEEEGAEAAVHRSKRALPPFKGGLLEYHPHVLAGPEDRCSVVQKIDALWIRDHFAKFNALAAESEAFRFALEACADWRFQRDSRAAIARIWAGIEALYAISSELVFRISLLTSSLLEPRGDSRRQRFYAVKKLYGKRSKAVHGESMPADSIASALRDSYSLLRDLLLRCVSIGRTPTKQDLDALVFD